MNENPDEADDLRISERLHDVLTMIMCPTAGCCLPLGECSPMATRRSQNVSASPATKSLAMPPRNPVDPFGKTAAGIPYKRGRAAEVFSELAKGTVARDKQIAVLAHRGLRAALSQDRDNAPAAFVRWLQQTTRAGLANQNMSAHPADRERLRLLKAFVETPVTDFFKQEQPASIPSVIGIQCGKPATKPTVDCWTTWAS